MQVIDYLKLANAVGANGPTEGKKPFAINLVTNFTDDILQKLLQGILVEGGIHHEIFAVPYKQYHLHLKDREGRLYQKRVDATFLFFDANLYRRSAFTEDDNHWQELLQDLKTYCLAQSAPVIMTNFITPYHGAYGNLFEQSPLFALIEEANRELKSLSKKLNNLYICDVNAIVHRHGEKNIRDFRGLYAFDTPFTNDFLLALAEEWFAYIRALSGRTKKCIVVDLDNTLWGGVVGETGPLGIALGPDYPGLAYQNFQHALLDFYKRGIILAIASKNNAADVAEVFAQNPHMILKEDHFAAVRVNWEDKAKNLLSVAEELNIGVDSLVFLDDDALNRDLVRRMLPEVSVPELPAAPEEYISALYGLNLFNQFELTEEDLGRAKMYADERKRKSVQYSTESVEEYVKALGIVVTLEKNEPTSIPRLSQLTQKTNQFNLTTKRYSEGELLRMMEDGALIFSGNVSDRFGEYGKTIMAIVVRGDGGAATLDTLLMSCRVMGRGVEDGFMKRVAEDLLTLGFERMDATYTPTHKNAPSKDFLSKLGFAETGRTGDTVKYSIDLAHLALLESTVTINSKNS
ncbi:MAG: HAD-IIIC family phosphatase [bacterium]|nr:HAD-IIIC family phosphatase [bacterium]